MQSIPDLLSSISIKSLRESLLKKGREKKSDNIPIMSMPLGKVRIRKRNTRTQTWRIDNAKILLRNLLGEISRAINDVILVLIPKKRNNLLKPNEKILKIETNHDHVMRIIGRDK